MKKVLLIIMLAGFVIAVNAQSKSSSVKSPATKDAKVTKTIDAKTSDAVTKVKTNSSVSQCDEDAKVKKEAIKKEACESESEEGCCSSSKTVSNEKKTDKPKK